MQLDNHAAAVVRGNEETVKRLGKVAVYCDSPKTAIRKRVASIKIAAAKKLRGRDVRN